MARDKGWNKSEFDQNELNAYMKFSRNKFIVEKDLDNFPTACN